MPQQIWNNLDDEKERVRRAIKKRILHIGGAFLEKIRNSPRVFHRVGMNFRLDCERAGATKLPQLVFVKLALSPVLLKRQISQFVLWI